MGTGAEAWLPALIGGAATVVGSNNSGGSSGQWNEDPRNYWASAPTEDLFPYMQDITATPNLLTDEAMQGYMNMGKDYTMSDYQKALDMTDANANARGVYDSGIRDANRNEQLDNLTRTLAEQNYERSYELGTNAQTQYNNAQQWNLTDQQRQQQAMLDAWKLAMQQGMGAQKGQPGAVAVTTSGTPATPTTPTTPTTGGGRQPHLGYDPTTNPLYRGNILRRTQNTATSMATPQATPSVTAQVMPQPSAAGMRTGVGSTYNPTLPKPAAAPTVNPFGKSRTPRPTSGYRIY